jgi:hypothetical protein
VRYNTGRSSLRYFQRRSRTSATCHRAAGNHHRTTLPPLSIAPRAPGHGSRPLPPLGPTMWSLRRTTRSSSPRSSWCPRQRLTALALLPGRRSPSDKAPQPYSPSGKHRYRHSRCNEAKCRRRFPSPIHGHPRLIHPREVLVRAEEVPRRQIRGGPAPPSPRFDPGGEHKPGPTPAARTSLHSRPPHPPSSTTT